MPAAVTTDPPSIQPTSRPKKKRSAASPGIDRATPVAELLSVDEVAAYLKVRPCSIYALAVGGRLRSIRIGRRLRIPKSAIAELTK